MCSFKSDTSVEKGECPSQSSDSGRAFAIDKRCHDDELLIEFSEWFLRPASACFENDVHAWLDA